MRNWFYADRHNQQQGPVSDRDLVAAFQRSEINATTLVWHEGLTGWLPLANVANELGLVIAARAPAQAPAAPTARVVAPKSGSKTWVIVLVVVLLGLLFMGGILAAIAIPAYSDYTQRAHITQAYVHANDVRLLVSEFQLKNERCPSNEDEGFDAPASYAAPYVEAIHVEPQANGNCGVRVVLRDLGSARLRDAELKMEWTPQQRWINRSTVPDRYLPMSLRSMREQ